MSVQSGHTTISTHGKERTSQGSVLAGLTGNVRSKFTYLTRKLRTTEVMRVCLDEGKGIKPYKTALAEAIEQTKKLDRLMMPTRTQNRIIGQFTT